MEDLFLKRCVAENLWGRIWENHDKAWNESLIYHQLSGVPSFFRHVVALSENRVAKPSGWWSFSLWNGYNWRYIWSRVPCSYPPQWYGSPGSTPFPSICRLLAAFLRSSLVFARSLQHFWLPASHLLGTCHLLDDLRNTYSLKVPTCYL